MEVIAAVRDCFVWNNRCSWIDMEVHVLDYGAGNVRSVVNAIRKAGCEVKFITSPNELSDAKKLIFPGVGYASRECSSQFEASTIGDTPWIFLVLAFDVSPGHSEVAWND